MSLEHSSRHKFCSTNLRKENTVAPGRKGSSSKIRVARSSQRSADSGGRRTGRSDRRATPWVGKDGTDGRRGGRRQSNTTDRRVTQGDRRLGERRKADRRGVQPAMGAQTARALALGIPPEFAEFLNHPSLAAFTLGTPAFLAQLRLLAREKRERRDEPRFKPKALTVETIEQVPDQMAMEDDGIPVLKKLLRPSTQEG